MTPQLALGVFLAGWLVMTAVAHKLLYVMAAQTEDGEWISRFPMAPLLGALVLWPLIISIFVAVHALLAWWWVSDLIVGFWRTRRFRRKVKELKNMIYRLRENPESTWEAVTPKGRYSGKGVHSFLEVVDQIVKDNAE
jgi:hypothetical protein